MASLEQVDITDTDAKLNIASATTKFEGVETEILQIEIDGELQTVLFHHVPENNITNKKTNKIASEAFTGSVYSTDLKGRVLSGFKINGGTIAGAYDFSPVYSIDPPIKLKEVIITNYYTKPVATNDAYTMMNYQFVRSQNNGSSMGIAYADYFKYLAIKAFNDKIKDDQLKPCLQKILNDLKKISASPGNMIANFTGDGYSTNYNWNVKSGTIEGLASGQTDPNYNM
ncbi:hypothetical protein ACM55I_01270 [Flavobacterium sp. GB2R13]|uniref:hypothetical protein n=1 Tax=Flavobacterium algoris TaxID=3398733 RepID=UPI003A851A7E